MKTSTHSRLWWGVSIVMILALVISACSAPATQAPTPTTEVEVAQPTNTPAPTATAEPEPTPVPAPVELVMLQDFEADAEVYDVYQATASLGETAKSGAAALKSASTEGEWHAVGMTLPGAPVDISQHGKICFWVYDTTSFNNGRAANTVGVKLFDASGASTERYTDNEGVGFNVKTKLNEWVPMCLNLVTYTGIDLTQIEKIEFTMYYAGEYYFDDIQILPIDQTLEAEEEVTGERLAVMAQDFEAEETYYSDYQAEVSLGTVAKSGATSLMSVSTEGEWHAFGAFLDPKPFDASEYSQVCFWIQDTTAHNDGKADNTVGVKLFDATGANAEVWTDHEGAGANPKTVKDEWVQMCLNLDAYTGIDLTQLEKVQFALFWFGTYYIDAVEFVKVSGAAVEVRTVGQDFEAEETYYSDYQAEVSLGTVAKSGATSLMSVSTEGEWHAFGAFLDPKPFDASQYDQLCFWIQDTTAHNDGKADNTVGVKLFDATGANAEVWTDHEGAGANPKTVKDEWVQMCLNLDVYTGIDLTQLEKVQFALFWYGTYYIDLIEFVGVAAGGSAKTVETLAQGFEAEETYYTDYQAEVSLGTVAKSGATSLMSVSTEGEWHAFGAFLDPQPFDASKYDQLCFWIQDTTAHNDGKADNTVGVKLFDASGANEEIWTDHAGAGENSKTVKDEWVQMCLNLDAYVTVDLTQLEKVQFALFWFGTYYIDDITFIGTETASAGGAPVVAQDFEAEETYYADYQAEVSLGTIAKSGATSLMSVSTEGEWHAFGAFLDPKPFDASKYDQLCFWIQDTTAHNDGKAENTVGVKLFDATGANEEIWTDHAGAGENPKTIKDEWVQMCLNLDAYVTVDLTQLDKVQFALFWYGTYYIDLIEFVP